MENPYDPPKSPVDAALSAGEKRTLFSPNQALAATVLGGMLPGIYILHQNFMALDNPGAAKKCASIGALCLVLLAVISLYLPASSGLAIGVTIAITVKQLVLKLQLDKAAIASSAYYRFSSGKRTVAVGLIGLLISLPILVALSMIFGSMLHKI